MYIKIENMLKSTLNPSSDVNDTGDNHLQAGMTRTSTARIDEMKKDVDEICKHYKEDLNNSQRLLSQLEVMAMLAEVNASTQYEIVFVSYGRFFNEAVQCLKCSRFPVQVRQAQHHRLQDL